MKNKIIIKNLQKKQKIGQEMKHKFIKAVKTVLTEEKILYGCEIFITITGDTKIKELNKNFRGKDSVTDVLSFPLIENMYIKYLRHKNGKPKLADCVNYENGLYSLGEIFISANTAKKQAEEYGQTTERELMFLVVHSTLHLLGYDHEISLKEEKNMIIKQKKIMRLLEENQDA